MREFSKFSPARWPALKDLQNAELVVTEIYLLTNRHVNSAGISYLPPEYGASDLGWTIEVFADRVAKLEAADRVVFDPATNEIMLCSFFADNVPMNDSHYRGAVKQIQDACSPKIKQLASEALDAAWSQACSQRASSKLGKAAVSDALLKRVRG